jgi:polyferredoxin
MKPLIFIRRIFQICAFALFFLVLYSTTYPLQGKFPASLIFKADPLIIFVISISERVFLGGIWISTALCIAAFILGRFFCGWLCPLGALFDFFRLFSPKRRQGSGRVPRPLGRLKFAILVVIFVLAAFGLQSGWLLDPLVISARFLSLNVIPLMIDGINSFFVFLIRTFRLYGGFYDFYRALKGSVLGVNVYYFSHSLFVFFFTVLVIFSSVMIARLWCRVFCPLGAGYGLLGRGACLRRRVSNACNHCNNCQQRCRMGAIAEGGTAYDKKECILCMDCIYDCPQKAISFGLKGIVSPGLKESGSPQVTRGQFLFIFLAGLFSLGAKAQGGKKSEERLVIRPPAALNEGEFLDRCIRCGNCMKVCITNGLQPSLFESGVEGIWTPRLVPEIGYCEYRCTLCGHVCPTGAITPLTEEEKLETRLGLAVIDRSICLPWAEGKECIVCEEHCPVSQKAIKLTRDDPQSPAKPDVDYTLCVGCGICQTKCPLRPVRAIRVTPL